MKRRDRRRWRVLVAAVAAVWTGRLLAGVDAFATVGEIKAATCTHTGTTVSDAANATALVEYEDCSTELVKVVVNSDGETQLDLRGRRIDFVESLPSVVNLDLSNNSILALENTSIPSALQTLNLSVNPFTSLQNFTFPNSLAKFTATSGKLASLQNFSFPDTVSTLNFSSNPVTRISGVTFPNSLKVLSVMSTVGLTEFEARQTDATLFATLDTFSVSSVTDVTCSDSDAMIRYVNETLLCVISDEAFEQKYYGGSSSKSASGSVGVVDITEAPELKATITQRRSKFLILSFVLLSLAFVALLVLLAMRNIHDRVARNRHTRLPKVYHPVLGSKKTWWNED